MSEKSTSVHSENQMEIVISQDEMIAELLLLQCAENLTIEELKRFLHVHGICFGIMEDRLLKLSQNPKDYIGKKVTVAEGIPAQHGQDGQVDLLFLSENNKDHQVSDSERVNFREKENTINVHAGQLLAKRIPPISGIDGTTVTGKRVLAKEGKPAHIRVGKNVYLDETGDHAFSAIDGRVSIQDHKQIHVYPVFEVRGNLDYRVGNIDFVGTVIIKGSILAGFKVKAGGDIHVLGDVEGAEIEAQGNIVIRDGIVAQGKGYVKAGNDLYAKFINQANVTAQNDIVVTQSILHSEIAAGRSIICTQAKGLIIGGKIQAGESIRANVIGNAMATPTICEVGAFPDLINELKEIKEKMIRTQEEAAKIDQGLKLLNQLLLQNRTLPPDKAKMREKLINLQKVQEKLLHDLFEQKERLEAKLEYSENAFVEVRNTVHPGTKLTFGKYTRFIKAELSRVLFRLHEGEINAFSI